MDRVGATMVDAGTVARRRATLATLDRSTADCNTAVSNMVVSNTAVSNTVVSNTVVRAPAAKGSAAVIRDAADAIDTPVDPINARSGCETT